MMPGVEGLWVRCTGVAADEAAYALLDDAERARAARRADPWPFVTAHALLRRLLSRTDGGDPKSYRFVRLCHTCGTDQHGKPHVAGRDDLHVSLSYSDTVAAACVSVIGEVGIDVEDIESADFEGFEVVTLHPEERAAFAMLSGDDLLLARARTWARKEALLKAIGHGLVVDPSELVLSSPEQPPRLLRWHSTYQAPRAASLADLELGTGIHEAAVALLAEEMPAPLFL